MNIPKEIYQFRNLYAGLPTKERKKRCNMTWTQIHEMLKENRTELNISWSLMLQLMSIAEEIDAEDNDDLITKLVMCYKKNNGGKIK